MRGRVRARLETAGPISFGAYAIAAAFTAYFCMYAFRKPLAAATFPGEIWGLEIKISFVISQILGYATSKFIGIRLLPNVAPARRPFLLLVLVGTAELALILFGLVPTEARVFVIFFNGLPLGMVWGLVFSFLEGRRTTEVLGAGLSASYIVAGGIVKTVGRALIEAGVPEFWMPAATGALFALPFVAAVLALGQIPPPSPEDRAARTERVPMNGRAQRAFFSRFAPGLAALTLLYMFLTAYRDFRDNFSAELFEELGILEASVFATTEVIIAPIVLLTLALIYRVRNNRRALFLIHGLMIAGSILMAAATLAFELGLIGGIGWMIGVGIGLYIGYVPFGCVLFDRLIATTRVAATAVFMIYVTDAFGYVGSIGVMLFKNFGEAELSWVAFFRAFSWWTAGLCTVAFALSWIYFARVTGPEPDA